MNIILAIILGSFFGYALYKAGASNSDKILSMLRLENLYLIKVILFAIGFSSILIFISIQLDIFDISHFNIKETNLGVIIGGIIFGLGFGLGGTCPGTCVAASTSGYLKKGLTTILGGLLGAFAFSLSYGFFKDIGLFDKLNFGKLTLFKISEKYQSIFSLGYSGLLIMGIIFMIIALALPMNFRKSSCSINS